VTGLRQRAGRSFRPWRRQHVPWTRVQGLVTPRGPVAGNARRKCGGSQGHRADLGRYPAARKLLAGGLRRPGGHVPVRQEQDLHIGGDNRGVTPVRQGCMPRSNRHGVPKPQRTPWTSGTPRYSPAVVKPGTARTCCRCIRLRSRRTTRRRRGPTCRHRNFARPGSCFGTGARIHREPGFNRR